LKHHLSNSIAAQGRLADKKLATEELSLTQGGEPTFVPHDTTEPEWNVAALGAEKLLYARRLARELAGTLFKGGVILQSFGKQYPGEPLPRWQVGVYRSRTGEPLWRNLQNLRLDQSADGSKTATPHEFIRQLAASLGLGDTTLPAYEDFAARLTAAGTDEATQLLPRFSRSRQTFVSRPLTESVRESWAACFEPAGWVLPLGHKDRKWHTGEWLLPEGDDRTWARLDPCLGRSLSAWRRLDRLR
jgi:uncharacterized protein (DUF2126 family)